MDSFRQSRARSSPISRLPTRLRRWRSLSRPSTVPVADGCGDGAVTEDEACDDGDSLWSAGRGCRSDCTLVRCGDPDDSGVITASDALLALRAAVGAGVCELSVCNVDGSAGGLSVVDALRILSLATGVALETGCPPPLG